MATTKRGTLVTHIGPTPAEGRRVFVGRGHHDRAGRWIDERFRIDGVQRLRVPVKVEVDR